MLLKLCLEDIGNHSGRSGSVSTPSKATQQCLDLDKVLNTYCIMAFALGLALSVGWIHWFIQQKQAHKETSHKLENRSNKRQKAKKRAKIPNLLPNESKSFEGKKYKERAQKGRRHNGENTWHGEGTKTKGSTCTNTQGRKGEQRPGEN